MSRADSAALIARLLTSSATTAKPAPASPALAASTAAFKARRLVWKAISSIVLTIFWVCSLAADISDMDSVSLFMESSAVSMESRASAIMESACFALSAFCLVSDAISSREEDVSSNVAACSEAPSATCWLDSDIWPAAPVTWTEALPISFTTPLSRKMMPRAVKKARKTPTTSVTAAKIATLSWVDFAVATITWSVIILLRTSSFALVSIPWTPSSAGMVLLA